jgi:hypothetical protein
VFTVINLKKHKDLFASEHSFLEFVRALAVEANRDGFRIVLLDEEVLGMMLSPEAAQQVLQSALGLRNT